MSDFDADVRFRCSFDPMSVFDVFDADPMSNVRFRCMSDFDAGQPMFDFIEQQGGYGDRQFAYRKGFSMKDLLAFVVLLWLRALDQSCKIGIYCSNIAGAFDRVSNKKLLLKCQKEYLM